MHICSATMGFAAEDRYLTKAVTEQMLWSYVLG